MYFSAKYRYLFKKLEHKWNIHIPWAAFSCRLVRVLISDGCVWIASLHLKKGGFRWNRATRRECTKGLPFSKSINKEITENKCAFSSRILTRIPVDPSSEPVKGFANPYVKFNSTICVLRENCALQYWRFDFPWSHRENDQYAWRCAALFLSKLYQVCKIYLIGFAANCSGIATICYIFSQTSCLDVASLPMVRLHNIDTMWWRTKFNKYF